MRIPTRHLKLLIGGLALGLLAGCTEEGRSPASPEVTPRGLEEQPSLVEAPIRDGTASVYTFERQVTYESTTAWFNRPDVDRVYTWSEEHRWSDGDGFWNIDQAMPAGQSPIYGNPPTPNVRSASLREDAVTLRDASGSLIALSDHEQSLNPDVTATELEASSSSASILSSRPSGAQITSAGNKGSLDLPGQARSAAVDRLVITPEGTGRELKRIRATFTEVKKPGRMLHFVEARGNTEVRLVFDPSIGAIIQNEVWEQGRIISKNRLEYARLRGHILLVEETTVLFTPEGEIAERFSEKYGGIQVN